MPFVDRLLRPVSPDIHVKQDGARNWILQEDLIYMGGQGDVWVVRAGYRTDLTSSPRVTNWLVPVSGIHSADSVLHDWLITDGIPQGLVLSVDADGIFRRVLKELGVPPVKRWLMWCGVRWGALFNSRRRAGWGKTALPVLFITLLTLCSVVIPLSFIVNALGMLVYGAAEFVATGGRKSGTIST
jgi:hypothetical protein